MPKRIKRLLLILILALSQSSCGGALLLAEGGISGTGITLGPISGFGSIYVNGIKYDVDNASFLRDGQIVDTQDTYQLGELIEVTGTVNADGTTGVADIVEFNDTFEGNVTASSQDGKRIDVLGQPILTNGATLLHGFRHLKDLQRDNIVEVSAQRNGDQQWIANSITLKQKTFIDGVSEHSIQGIVSNLDTQQQTFNIGKQAIYYGDAATDLSARALENQAYIQANSFQALQNGLLIIATLATVNTSKDYPEGSEIEVKGYIEQFTNSSDFQLEGLTLTTTGDVEFQNGQESDLQLNTLIEVKGIINQQNILEASVVSIKQQSGDNDDSSEFEGIIDSIDNTNKRFTMLEYTFVTDKSTIIYEEINEVEQSLQFSDLAINNDITVYGRVLADGNILALSIERVSTD